ncbi:MAG TPA: pilus assembly protein PilP [Nitrospira sp.]|nr:pilus assembly protein PilP [Nitrospira sp.]
MTKIGSLGALFGTVLLLAVTGPALAEPGLASHLGQVAPLRQDSVKVSSPTDLAKEAPQPGPALTPSPDLATAPMDAMAGAPPFAVGGYDPAGRRDPFSPVLSQLVPGQTDPTLPPLQRIGLTDLNLIAIIWGAYGYTAMVQTPDGNGYTVRKGTRVGPNSGVVSAVTEKGIIVQERFTDVYGRKQEREYVKLLHPKEGLE